MQNDREEYIWTNLKDNQCNLINAAWEKISPWVKERVLKALHRFEFDLHTREDIIMHVAGKLLKIELRSLDVLKSWIRTTATNKAIDICRQRSRYFHFSSDQVEAKLGVEAVQLFRREHDARDRAESLAYLSANCVMLTASDRELLQLLLDHSYPQRGSVQSISKILRCPPNRIYQRILRVKRKLGLSGEEFS